MDPAKPTEAPLVEDFYATLVGRQPAIAKVSRATVVSFRKLVTLV